MKKNNYKIICKDIAQLSSEIQNTSGWTLSEAEQIKSRLEYIIFLIQDKKKEKK